MARGFESKMITTNLSCAYLHCRAKQVGGSEKKVVVVGARYEFALDSIAAAAATGRSGSFYANRMHFTFSVVFCATCGLC